MLKAITRKDVLNALRKHEAEFSKNPNLQNEITLKRQEWNEDTGQSESFDVDVCFTYPNYIYLIFKLYDVDKNMVKDGNLGVEIFSLVQRIKTIVKQLQNDGYLNIFLQKCTFHTEMEEPFTQYDEIDDNEVAEYQTRTGKSYKRYIQVEKKFSKEELQNLTVAIMLTTKGCSDYLYFKEKFFSEPSLLVSIIAVLVSILLPLIGWLLQA
jgi:hypothetical protein